MGVGNRIAALCADKGLSIRKLALKADVPYSTLYSAIKRDSNGIDMDTLKKIADALGVSWFELLLEATEEQSSKVAEYMLQKLDDEKVPTDKVEDFVGKDVLLSYYNTLNIDGKLEAYNILVRHSTLDVIKDSLKETKQLADTPQYQKKAEE